MTNHRDIVKKIASQLVAQGLKLVTAESCTGGLVASMLTGQAGSSAYFERGFVAYSNAAKQDLLAVPLQLLAQYGAVSEPVAIAMAKGALQHSDSQLALAITGVAGPGGGTEDKPVGTVCFAWAGQSRNTQSLQRQFTGSRLELQQQAGEFALQQLLEFL